MTLEEALAIPYIGVVYADNTGDGSPCFVAEHPDLPGCIAHVVLEEGMVPEEAIEAVQEELTRARTAYLKSLLDDGEEPPMPSSQGGPEWVRVSQVGPHTIDEVSAAEPDGNLAQVA